MRIIRRGFYGRPTSVVARDLLGKVLVRRTGGRTLAGRIVETEACTSDDPASHAFRGLTERNRALFGEVGRAWHSGRGGVRTKLSSTGDNLEAPIIRISATAYKGRHSLLVRMS